MSELHIGRSWTGHPLEDACPCAKAPCGLVIQGQALDTCPEHALGAFKSIRQGHPSDRCPGESSDG